MSEQIQEIEILKYELGELENHKQSVLNELEELNIQIDYIKQQISNLEQTNESE